MPTLIIVTQGIALAYQKDGHWRTIFPFGEDDDCHNVVLKRGVGDTGIQLRSPGQEIVIRANGPDTTTSEGANFGKFVDLTDSTYAHSNLRLKEGWRDHSVVLTTEHAVLSQNEPTRSRYWLKEKNGAKATRLDYVAYSGRLEISAAEIAIEAPAVEGIPPVNDDTLLVIDNECYVNPTEDTGDLALLYKYIIEDPSGSEYVLERDIADGGKPSERTFAWSERGDTNPRPYDPTLPCNEYVAKRLIEE